MLGNSTPCEGWNYVFCKFSSGMRISGGKARGIPLRVDKKGDVRPATENTRERLFSSIVHSVQNASTLDLFAGTGAYGLESLSRGAKSSTFVEKNRSVFNHLKINLAAVLKSANLKGETGRLVHRDVVDFVRIKPEHPYDLIFIDPPYSEIEKLCPKIFGLLLSNQYLSADGLIILETPGELKIEFAGWKTQRVLGKEKRGSPVHRCYAPHPPSSDQELAER